MRKFGVKAKLLLLAVFMSIVSMSVGLVSWWSSKQTIESYEVVTSQDVPTIRAANRMLLSFRLARIELLHLVLNQSSPELAKKAIQTIDEQWEAFEADQKILVTTSPELSRSESFERFKQSTEKAKQLFKSALDLYKRNSDPNSAERREMTRIALSEFGGALGAEIRESTKAMIAQQATTIEANVASAQGSARQGNQLNLLVTIIGSLIGFVLAMRFALRLGKKMQSLMATIAASAESVSAAAYQISTSSNALSQSVTAQASSLQETTAALDEISSMIAKSSESAANADHTAQESQTKATEGQAAMNQMMGSMNEISDGNDTIMKQITHSNEQMTDIVKVIQEIGEKTKVINDIVFQTKLLSFNASVEAARAGEHGKGFTVVAEEVGNLAQMSGNAAKEISDMLHESIAKVEAIVSETKSSVTSLVSSGKKRVGAGVDLAQRCSGVLDQIVQNVSQVTHLAKEIAHSSREQTIGVGEINKAMARLDIVTRENSTSSQEAAAASELLFTQAASLKSAVTELAVEVMGAGVQSGYSSERPSVPASTPPASGSNSTSHASAA